MACPWRAPVFVWGEPPTLGAEAFAEFISREFDECIHRLIVGQSILEGEDGLSEPDPANGHPELRPADGTDRIPHSSGRLDGPGPQRLELDVAGGPGTSADEPDADGP